MLGTSSRHPQVCFIVRKCALRSFDLLDTRHHPAPSVSGLWNKLILCRSIHPFVNVEVELSFRSKCQKLRVVSTLTGGAHFILKGTHSTVALRVYDANAIATLSSAFTQRTATSASTSEGTGNNANDTAKASSSPALVDFADGLKQFRDSFMYTIVFFVLPPGAGGGGGELRRAQLTQAGSVVNVAQRALSSSRRSTDQDQSKRVSRIVGLSFISCRYGGAWLLLECLFFTEQFFTIISDNYLSQLRHNSTDG